MNTDINSSTKPRNNRAFAGLFLIALGVIYLLRQLDFFFFPGWMFSWPMLLIIIGFISGIKHNFRNPGSFIMMLIGGVFLIARIACVHIHFFWPVILIAIGIRMIMRRGDTWSKHNWHRGWHQHHDTTFKL